jgi:hypothetical protein
LATYTLMKGQLGCMCLTGKVGRSINDRAVSVIDLFVKNTTLLLLTDRNRQKDPFPRGS